MMIAAWTLAGLLQGGAQPAPRPAPEDPLDGLEVVHAARVAGVSFTDGEIELMLPDVIGRVAAYTRLRDLKLANGDLPAFEFDPTSIRPEARPVSLPEADWVLPEAVRPSDLEELAFADIPTLASLVRSRQVSCVELAELFMGRLECLDRELFFLVTLTRERALRQAELLDLDLERGTWRGLLHGIPWGAKDLVATRGTPTTWGAAPYRDQHLDYDAEVVRRLDQAGAVLVAKLSLGALAWGDVWYGGTTRNPWNPEQGSSGSSAGSASAVAAGAVPFAIGSETLGSIVSPSDRCGNTSLRPSFGRVSRHGAMALSWTMDKLGPIARSVQDAAIVFEAIAGQRITKGGSYDPDPTVRFRPPFRWAGSVALDDWVVGVPARRDGETFPAAFDAVLARLDDLGATTVEVELPDYPVGDLMVILNAEAATVFDELTRSDLDDELTRQVRRAWPNVFRAARLIPAVEYLRAMRLRRKLMVEMDRVFVEVDALVHPSFASGLLSITNLTGHPTVIAPCGFREDQTPFSVSFTGRIDDEQRLLALAHQWQVATSHHLRHPALDRASSAAETEEE